MDRKIKKKRWTWKRLFLLVAAVGVIGYLAYMLFIEEHVAKQVIRSDRLIISTVEQGAFQEFIQVSGTIIPIKTNYLDAIEGGNVETVFLEAGSFVNKGDRILKLANTNLLLDIMNREAELYQQRNNLQNTKLAMEKNDLDLRGQLLELDYRIKGLKRSCEGLSRLAVEEIVSSQSFDEAMDEYDYLVKKRDLTLAAHKQDTLHREAQIKQLEESIQRIRGNLDLVRRNLENLVIRAPVSGHLTSLNAEIGESKTRGERLGQIDVLDGFKVRLQLDEYYISRVGIGLPGSLTFGDGTYPVIVQKIFPEVVEGRFDVDVVFSDKEPTGIRRGQSLRVRLELGDLDDAVLLARGAFFHRTGGQWAYVLEGDGSIARKRAIKLGNQNPTFYEVIDGLEPGERVITSSYDHLGDVDQLVLNEST